MSSPDLPIFLVLLPTLLLLLAPKTQAIQYSSQNKLFSEYIGAEFKGVKFSDVPINPHVDFHFILSFAIDYTTSSPPTPTNGNFNIFWDTNNLSPSDVVSIKHQHSNVKVALSLGGDSVFSQPANFTPVSVDSWVANAVSSLTKIITRYNLDGIDIDYEHFLADPKTFAECIGKLLTTLKKKRVISFASIAPFDNEDVQSHYLALWKKYARVIDTVNFQFYAYDNTTTVSQFLKYFDKQSRNYTGGEIMTSFISDGSKGLTPAHGFFDACERLRKEGKLRGVFVWCADDSKSRGFRYEKRSQVLLAMKR
ncbi:hypothetical protein QJS10_CPA03g01369 [Acorus calamus]|uniref:GH18 domain-containing protein n=1 Tax=Acorus calamus TaxID=4465 RepID=A0AAV9F924_ACOCL|nr:hypothetical protein QJS10_CPA03g01369 [Acorus calamus]